MICSAVREIARRLLAVPEIKIVNHDTPILRALVAENAELRRRLGLPRVCSVQLPDGHTSRITHDLPTRVWASRVN